MNRRELAFRAIAVLLGVALPVAVVEGLAALVLEWDKAQYKPVMPEAVRASINRNDHHIPTTPDPYLMFRMEPDIRRERVQTNAYGLREGPLETSPAPDVVRVLLLGGSVAWGYTSNSNDDTIASYLEEALAPRAAELPALRGRRVEVLNAGVPAYVSWQEALSYAVHLHALEPDWVLSLDATNDIASAVSNGTPGVPMRYFLTRSAYLGVEPGPLASLGSWLLSSSRELHVVRAVERLRPKSVEDLGAPPPDRVARSLREAAAFLSDAAKPHGARVITILQPMVILPGTKPLTDFEAAIVREFDHRTPGSNAYYAEAYDAMRTSLADLAREQSSYDWIDATDAFGETAEPVYVDHCHLTPLGRRLLAERIADGWIEAIGGVRGS